MESPEITFREIAQHIGMSEQSAHRLHQNVLVKLKEALIKEPYVKEWLNNRKETNKNE